MVAAPFHNGFVTLQTHVWLARSVVIVDMMIVNHGVVLLLLKELNIGIIQPLHQPTKNLDHKTSKPNMLVLLLLLLLLLFDEMSQDGYQLVDSFRFHCNAARVGVAGLFSPKRK